MTAASAGDADASPSSAAAGADVNASDSEGRTALHFACGYGEMKCAEMLIDAKANADAVDEQEHAASLRRRIMAATDVSSFVDAALRDPPQPRRQVPLDVAKLNDQEDVVQALEADVFL